MLLTDLRLDTVYVIGNNAVAVLVSLDKVTRLAEDRIEPCAPGNLKRGWLLYVAFSERETVTAERHAELIAKAAEYRKSMPTSVTDSDGNGFRLGLVRPLYIKAEWGDWCAKREADAERRRVYEREAAERAHAAEIEKIARKAEHMAIFSKDAPTSALAPRLE